jgi:hypothetical protein
VRHDAILDAAERAIAKVVVEDAATIDKVPATIPQTPKAHQIGILAVAILGAVLMALSQLWNWITGG